MTGERDAYVAKVNWLVQSGREELIDEVADEFERRRPACRAGREQFWVRDAADWSRRAAS